MRLKFDPGKWHVCDESEWRTCTENANCYSYALNRPDYFWAFPGMGYAKTGAQHYFDSIYRCFDKDDFDGLKKATIKGAIHDGLILVAEPVESNGYYLVALFFADPANGFDFHWFRKDDDGTWSHKYGWFNPTNKDEGGNAIYDPRQIKHPNYPNFYGFFLAPRAGVMLKQDFPLIKVGHQP